MSGSRLVVGVLTPHAADGPEVEIPAMTSGQVEVPVARLGELVSSAGPDPQELDVAVAGLPLDRVDALAFTSTSGAYAMGPAAERTLVDRLARRWSRPVVSGGAAAITALRARGLERVMLVHPPWFAQQLDGAGVAYYEEQGFDPVVARASQVPRDPKEVRTEHVVDAVGSLPTSGAEAIFLAGHGFRAAGAVAELERRTGLLVLESNQVLLWSILAATRTTLSIRGYGRLFT